MVRLSLAAYVKTPAPDGFVAWFPQSGSGLLQCCNENNLYRRFLPNFFAMAPSVWFNLYNFRNGGWPGDPILEPFV